MDETKRGGDDAGERGTRAPHDEPDAPEPMEERPSDSVDLVGDTAASEALTDYRPIGPSEAESRNALGMSPVEPDRHRHASRRKPR